MIDERHISILTHQIKVKIGTQKTYFILIVIVTEHLRFIVCILL